MLWRGRTEGAMLKAGVGRDGQLGVRGRGTVAPLQGCIVQCDWPAPPTARQVLQYLPGDRTATGAGSSPPN